MDSFRYALAGEFSFRRDVLTDLRIPSDWGLEIGVLSEMHRNYAHNRLCQVDIPMRTSTTRTPSPSSRRAGHLRQQHPTLAGYHRLASRI